MALALLALFTSPSFGVWAAQKSAGKKAGERGEAGGAAHKGRRVAIHPLKPLGLDPETVANLEEVLRGEVAGVPGIRLIGEARARKVADALGCDGSPPCLAVYAKKVGAAEVVHGVVAGLGDSYSIALKRVDRQGKVLARVDTEVGGEREVLIDGIRAAAYQLLRPDLYTGSLEIVGDVEGATLFVDGKPRGTLPLEAPLTGLKPGQHAVKIVKKGYQDFDKFVDVRFRRTSVVEVDLASSTVSGVIYEEEAPPEVPLVRVVDAPAA
ncbi:MAG: PEGA domain-containing protein, partial [Deltaproteobacteria bacterium]